MKIPQNRVIGMWLAGLLMLLVGIYHLHDIFYIESENAKAELAARQTTLSQFAVKALQQILHSRLKFAQADIKQLSQDPLRPDQGLLYLNRGEQLLPRPVRHPQLTEHNAKELYTWVKQVQPLDLVIEKSTPWEERLYLLSSFKLAVENQDQNEIRWAFRDFREHRASGRIGPERDIPFTIAVLEYFLEKSDPEKSLIQGILRDGSIVEQEQGLFGLQRNLLLHRNHFSKDDFIFLRDKIIELSKLVSVEYQDFLQQSKSSSIAIELASLDQTVSGFKGNWYIEPIGGEELVGISVDFSSLIEQVRQEMLLLALINPEDSLHFDQTSDVFHPIAGLNIRIESDLWHSKTTEINELYWLKTGLLSICALLFVLVFILGAFTYIRERNYIQLKSNFVSTVSHELRTPLASLRLMSETIERLGLENAKTKDYPKRITQVVSDLNFLVENILSFNRINKDTRKLQLSSFNINDIIQELEFELKTFGSKKVKIDDTELGDISISADMELIRIMFRNLITNAIKYNRSKTVKIRMYIPAVSDNIIAFEDNGIGIPSDQWQHVFDESVRLKPNDPVATGTGLGLTICARIMALHHGHIEIYRSSDSGTCFHIHFQKQQIHKSIINGEYL